MDKFKYKNTSDQTQTVIGVGQVKSGKVIESEKPINNSNFELQENRSTKKSRKRDK